MVSTEKKKSPDDQAGWLAGSGGGAIINHTYTREKKGRKKQSRKSETKLMKKLPC